jgi:hypothetical protein
MAADRHRPHQLFGAFHPVCELATETLAGWEVMPADPQQSSSLSLEPQLVAMALTALAGLPAGQFVLARISARGLTTDAVRQRLAGRATLDGLALIVLGRVNEHGLLIIERARRRGALVGCDATGAEGDAGRIRAFNPDLLSLAARCASETGRDPAPDRWVSDMVRLARELGSKTLMHEIGDRDDAVRFAASGVTFGQGAAIGPPQRQAPVSGDTAGSVMPIGDASGSADTASPAVSPASELQELAERAPCMQVGESLGAIVDLSLDDAEHDWLVIVDPRGRPVGLVERAALLRGEPFERRVEVVGAAMPIRIAAQAALARSRVDRSHPLALCDAEDRYLGLLRIERLLEALAA